MTTDAKCPMHSAYDPSGDGAQMSFDGRMSYGDYLHIDQILTAQSPATDAHDEMLFIIQHQTSELWMKLALHELNAARVAIAANRAPEAFKMLARIEANLLDEELDLAEEISETEGKPDTDE